MWIMVQVTLLVQVCPEQEHHIDPSFLLTLFPQDATPPQVPATTTAPSSFVGPGTPQTPLPLDSLSVGPPQFTQDQPTTVVSVATSSAKRFGVTVPAMCIILVLVVVLS